MRHYKRVLAIAGSDSGGCAGIQADVKTITSLGCFAATAITSLTAQNTLGVQDTATVDASFVLRQVKSVLEDLGADSIKVGMLQREEVIKSVAQYLCSYTHIPMVLDPVMVATSGDILLDTGALDSLKRYFLGLATLVTPNVHEAQILCGFSLEGRALVVRACHKLYKMGAKNVLITGIRERDKMADMLFLGETQSVEVLERPIVETENTHGTGCTYSSSIASFLALGLELRDAVKSAKEYIHRAIESGSEYKLGRGAGPVNHLRSIGSGP